MRHVCLLVQPERGWERTKTLKDVRSPPVKSCSCNSQTENSWNWKRKLLQWWSPSHFRSTGDRTRVLWSYARSYVTRECFGCGAQRRHTHTHRTGEQTIIKNSLCKFDKCAPHGQKRRGTIVVSASFVHSKLSKPTVPTPFQPENELGELRVNRSTPHNATQETETKQNAKRKTERVNNHRQSTDFWMFMARTRPLWSSSLYFRFLCSGFSFFVAGSVRLCIHFNFLIIRTLLRRRFITLWLFELRPLSVAGCGCCRRCYCHRCESRWTFIGNFQLIVVDETKQREKMVFLPFRAHCVSFFRIIRR